MTYPELETLRLERVGPVGWLINNRPDQLNAMNALMRDEFELAWRALDADPEVRVIVHTGEGRAFQTGVDVTEIASDGVGMQRYRESVENFDLHFTAWHNEVWKPVITAVNGICAGGGFHWIADSDIVIAASGRAVLRPARVDRAGRLDRGDRADEAHAGGSGDAHGLRRPPRAHAGRARLRARHGERGRRSARPAARRRPGARREDRPQLAGRDGRDEARCGARSSWASPTRAGPAPGSSCRCGATPTRKRARARSPRSASPRWQPLGVDDRSHDRHRDRRVHRAARGSGARVQPVVRA